MPTTFMLICEYVFHRYVIMQVMLEAGEDFLKVEKVEGKDGQPDLLITMDRSKVCRQKLKDK
jgi:dipeptidyl-peptidase III